MTFFILCFLIGLVAARMRSATAIVGAVFCLIIVFVGAIFISGEVIWQTLRMLALGCLMFNLGFFGTFLLLAAKK